MDSLYFANPGLLYGALLAAAPVLIHLLYRRRFQRVDWGPMKYLKLSLRQNRRRMRVEQWLLLTLRMAAVAALFLLVARPSIRASQWAAWLGGGRGGRLVVIDNSLSMGYRDGGASALERAREFVQQLLASGEQRGPVTLVFAAQPDASLLVETAADDAVALPWNAVDSHVSWQALLGALEAHLDRAAPAIEEATLVTDLRAAGWDEGVRPVAEALAACNANWRILDVGSPAAENLALVELTGDDRPVLAGGAASWRAVIRNDGTAAASGRSATWYVDGAASVVQLPAIPAGATLRVPLGATFQTSGLHQVEFALPDDALPGDNRRRATLDVRQALRVVLVDGEPGAEPRDGELYFLAAALQSQDEREAGHWQVDSLRPADWRAGTLGEEADVVVLANVSPLGEAAVRSLEGRVRRGTGLMIFLGDQVDAAEYERLLGREGQGLLPGRLGPVVEEEFRGLVLEDAPESPLAALTQFKPAHLESLRMRKHQRLAPDPAETGVRVLARWNLASGAPAAVEKRLGAGRVVCWTTTADAAWGDWTSEPSYAIGMVEALAQLSRRGDAHRLAVAGERLRRPLDAGEEPGAGAVVETPGGEAPRPPAIVALPEGADGRALEWAATDRAGLYRFRWPDAARGVREDWIAVNPDVRESDLRRLEIGDLGVWLAPLKPEIVSLAALGSAGGQASGRALWPLLAGCLIGLLVLESSLAAWSGRQR